MLKKIGMGEFRNNLAKYLGANEPVAIVDRGETIGYFLPSRKHPEQGDRLAHLKSPHSSQTPELESLMRAAEKLDRLLAEKEITEDELVEEFRQLRR
ncbi:MAG: type II toxin-antitoxin system Phd/YefM family antitoxin [Xenococcus sp. MO_188.B8]|nr:type II toxin-antitoxin system Phd/YefM family antitoxin [Xenococcus sp. MO_188.B8]